MKKIFTAISWIVIVLSLPFLITAIIDFIDSKDFVDVVIFVIVLIPFTLSVKYLSKNKKQKQEKETSEQDHSQLTISKAEISSHELPAYSLKTEEKLPENIQQTYQLQHSEPSTVQSETKRISTNDDIIATEKVSANDDIIFPNWYISVSFGKSASDNYMKAVTLAKAAPQYREQIDNGNILHQAVYSEKPKEYLAFIMLYELIKNWKSAFVIVNGKLVDRKIIGQLNYCYGDRCRSGNIKFCYGASYMTENPFGCHRLQISACNNPWWSYYKQSGPKWILDKEALLQRINSYSAVYSMCPVFDYDRIISVLNQLPYSLSDKQYKKLLQEKHQSIYLTL